MEQVNHRNDPVSALLDGSGASAIIQKDAYGNDRVVFTPEERERFRQYLADELRDGIEASKERWNKTRERIRVYEGKDKDGEAKSTIIPIAKRNANQIISYIVQSILGRTPIASAKPQDYGMMEVVFPTPTGPVMDEASIEEVAQGLEDLLQDTLDTRIDFRGPLTDWVTDIVIGAGVPMLKWCYEKVETNVLVPNVKATPIAAKGKTANAKKAMILPFHKEISVLKGCPHKVYAVSDLNLVYPADTMDVQDTPWLAERLPRLDAMAMHTKIQSGYFDFGLPDGEEASPELVKRVIQGKPADAADNPQRNPDDDGKELPRDYQDAYEVYAYWPIRDESGKITIHSLECGFHLGAEELLCVKLLPYGHKLRPYTPGFYRKKPHEFESGSVVEDMEPFQDLTSSIFRLEIQNAVQSALKGYIVRRGSPAHQDLERKRAKGGMKPGDFITVADVQGEILPFQTGGSQASLFPVLNLAMSEADRVVNLSESDRGDIPNRTAAATVAKIHEQSTMQRAMALESVRSSLSLGFYMLLENIRQYSPAGETLATYDPRKRAMQERAISMPTGAINEKFRIVVNASSQDQTKDAERERLTIDYNMIVGSNAQVLQNAAALFNPQTTEPYERIIKFCLEREENALERLLALHRNDAETATLDKMEIEAILQAKREALAQQQQMAAPAPEAGAEGQGEIPPEMMQMMQGGGEPPMEMMNGQPETQLQFAGPEGAVPPPPPPPF